MPLFSVALAACSTALADDLRPPSGDTASTPSAAPATATPGGAEAASPTASEAATADAAASLPAIVSPPAADSLPTPTLVLVEPTRSKIKPPVLSISAPAKNALIPMDKAATFDAKVAAKGWKPASGDHLCVVLDRGSCRPVADATKPVRLSDLGTLDEGQHVFSVLARRASGEFYRPDGKLVPFATVSFFVGKKVTPVFKEGSPMLFYTPPAKGPAPTDGVLLDFFVANAVVKRGDVIVTASVGGPGIDRGVGVAIEENKPVRIKNARPGEYISRMTLLQYIPELGDTKSMVTVTYSARPISGPFGEITRSFFVTK
jgi:hypothetical protein